MIRLGLLTLAVALLALEGLSIVHLHHWLPGVI
jgi:hypothetical protein